MPHCERLVPIIRDRWGNQVVRIIQTLWGISGFRRDINEIFAHLRCYAAYTGLQGSSSPRNLKMVPTGCPETSLTKYRSTLRNIPKERRSHTIINIFFGKNLQTFMFKKWRHVQIRRTPTVNKISNFLPYLNSNLRRVVNVVFFLLGDFPASGCYVPTFRNNLFHLQRSCEQEEIRPMKME